MLRNRLKVSTTVFAMIAASISFSAPRASAQLRHWQGTPNGDYFGFTIDGVGDLDGDGHGEVIVGSPRSFNIGCCVGTSYASVYSGQTGAVLYTVADEGDNHEASIVRGIGDWNGDSVPDFLVCNEPDFCFGTTSGMAQIFSGNDGGLLHTIPVNQWADFWEQSAEAAGDVDSDGHADVILGEPHTTNGDAHIWSGGTETLVRTIQGDNPGDEFGIWVQGVGDWNGDGRDDVAISASAGYTRVYSAVSGAQLFEVLVSGEVEAPGDFDGDGQIDLMVGGVVYSGSTSTAVLTLSGWVHYRPFGDVNGDGVRDFLAGDPDHDSKRGRVGILSGADGSLVMSIFTGISPGDRVGFDVASAGDVDANGGRDIILGAPGEATFGGAYVFSGPCDASLSTFCIGAPNSAGAGARMRWEGSWSVSDEDLVLVAEDCPRSQFGLFIYGTTMIQVPFGNGFRCVGGTVFRLLPPVSTGATGRATYATNYSAGPMGSGPGQIFPGANWHFQYWYRDVLVPGAGFNLSDGLSATFCP